jgi:hypothetical protein
MTPTPKLFAATLVCIKEHAVRSRKIRLLSLLFVSMVAVSPVRAQPAHPIVGKWSWSLFGGKCQETFQFRPDASLVTTSGAAVDEWSYEITPEASEANFYTLNMVLKRQNGKKDCYGDQARDGLQIESFIQMSPAKDRFINCKSASLAACFGPLGKIP